jgi:hypothetical protein
VDLRFRSYRQRSRKTLLKQAGRQFPLTSRSVLCGGAVLAGRLSVREGVLCIKIHPATELKCTHVCVSNIHDASRKRYARLAHRFVIALEFNPSSEHRNDDFQTDSETSTDCAAQQRPRSGNSHLIYTQPYPWATRTHQPSNAHSFTVG